MRYYNYFLARKLVENPLVSMLRIHSFTAYCTVLQMKNSMKTQNDDGNEKARTPPSYHSSYSHNRIDAINDKHQNSSDTKHHAVSNRKKKDI